MTVLPLLAPRDLAAPMAWRHGAPISAAQFLGEAAALARTLPAEPAVVNLCQDRYLFALALAAALLNGQTSLMPPNALPDTLRQLIDPTDPNAPPVVLSDDAALDTGALPKRLIERPTAEPVWTVPTISVDFEAVRLLTSGSTGVPQPHGKRWDALTLNIAAEAQRLAALLDRESLDSLVLVGTVPAQHSYGIESSVLLALLGGACLAAERPFYPADIADALARVPAPRALITTPFHLKTLLLADVPLPPVDMVLSATAPLSPQLAQRAEQRTGGRTLEIYGCTEAGQVAARRTTAGDTWTLLGDLRMWKEASDTDVPRTLVVGGHVLVPTEMADVVVLHDAQHFDLLGRANDLIHVAGKRSSLAHLNFQLNRIEGVDDGAFWMPAPDGEDVARPIAFVVSSTLTSADVIRALRGCLESAFVPRRVVMVPALPREGTGKLTAQTLARFAAATLGATDTASVTTDPTAPYEVLVPADHPAFAGHFPGHPLLPGVALLSLVMEGLAERPTLQARLGATPRIDQVKFLAPVGPAGRVQVQLKPQGSGVQFELRSGATVVARGQLSPAPAA